MVIITGGIDLSVGSLIALSSVCATLLVERFGGAETAGTTAPRAVLAGRNCRLSPWPDCISGTMVTGFGIPSFIVTLAMMLIASGAAYKLTRRRIGQPACPIRSCGWAAARILAFPTP